MTLKLTPEEAETKMRALIAEANIQDELLDTFIARIPTLRTSDLFGYIADHVALTTALGILEDGELIDDDLERAKLVSYAAVLALKDEIDRRFPVPTT